MKYDECGNSLTNFGMFSTLVLSMIGFGVFTYSQNIGKLLGRNGFISTLIFGFVYLIFFVMMNKTIKLNNYENLENIIESSFGKIFGRAIMFLISISILLLISIQLRIFIDSIKVYLFPNINSEFMINVTLIVCLYVVANGEKVITGLNEIMFVFLCISCLIIFLVVFKNLDLSNVLPLEIRGGDKYFFGFLTLSSYFSGSIMIFYLMPMFKNKSNIKGNTSYKALVFSFAFLALVFLICVSTLNINQTITSIWPIILSFTTVDIPGGFVERIEGIIITISIIFFVVNFINLYFCSSYINSKSLNSNNHKIFSLIFMPLIYILSLLPRNLNDVYFIISKIIFPIGIFISLIFPSLLFLISFLKNRKRGV